MRLRSRLGEYFRRRLQIPNIPAALDRLAAIGFVPARVFDIGAHKGDFASLCVVRWPATQIVCFEVLEPQLQLLRARFADRELTRVFPALVGAQSRANVQFNINDTASSVLADHSQKVYPINTYPMVSIDEVVKEYYENRGPDFLKIDVQGYELEVLKGAERSLSAIRVILVETNLLDIYRDAPLLPELMEWMHLRNWTPYDVCGLIRRPRDEALWQADLIFVPESSKLRADKRWS